MGNILQVQSTRVTHSVSERASERSAQKKASAGVADTNLVFPHSLCVGAVKALTGIAHAAYNTITDTGAYVDEEQSGRPCSLLSSNPASYMLLHSFCVMCVMRDCTQRARCFDQQRLASGDEKRERE